MHEWNGVWWERVALVVRKCTTLICVSVLRERESDGEVERENEFVRISIVCLARATFLRGSAGYGSVLRVYVSVFASYHRRCSRHICRL